VAADIFSTAKTVLRIFLLTFHQLNVLSCISKKEVLHLPFQKFVLPQNDNK
jgi:hypothetical protein